MTSLETERVEPTPRRIRVRLGDRLVADSDRALLLIQYGPNGLPTYFVPLEDVVPDVLTDEVRGAGRAVDVDRSRAGHAHAASAAWTHPHPKLTGHVTFSWRQLEWYEEDEPVFVHALDPYKRVDTRRSSRLVEIRVGGETVARSIRPLLLFETSLPTRYYLPFADVRAGMSGAQQPRDEVPVQGPGAVLVRAGGRSAGAGRRLELSGPDPADPGRQGPGLLLHRAGRPRPRRRAAAADRLAVVGRHGGRDRPGGGPVRAPTEHGRGRR